MLKTVDKLKPANRVLLFVWAVRALCAGISLTWASPRCRYHHAQSRAVARPLKFISAATR
jgi:hypothetical protein